MLPGEPLVFDLCCDPEGVGFNTGHSYRVDDLPMSEGKQAKSQVSFIHVLLCDLPPEGVAQI